MSTSYAAVLPPQLLSKFMCLIIFDLLTQLINEFQTGKYSQYNIAFAFFSGSPDCQHSNPAAWEVCLGQALPGQPTLHPYRPSGPWNQPRRFGKMPNAKLRPCIGQVGLEFWLLRSTPNNVLLLYIVTMILSKN